MPIIAKVVAIFFDWHNAYLLHALIWACLATCLVCIQILIIGLVQIQVLENWFEVYAEENLIHSIKRGLAGVEIGFQGFNFGMITSLNNKIVGEKFYLILR